MTIKPGRPAKLQFRCHFCRNSCSPRDGDWYHSPKSTDQQLFACRPCERKHTVKLQQVVPAR